MFCFLESIMMEIDHIAIYVSNLEVVKDFFIAYFRAEANEMYHNPKTGLRSYFLSFDNGCRIEIMSRPEVHETVFDEFRAGFIHLSFSVGGRKAVDTLTARLEEDGYVVLSGPRMTGDGYYESCIKGIENLLIEICE